jgi:hypothetical protein
MALSELVGLAVVGVVFHELACRGLAPWPFGSTPPACWFPEQPGAGTYSSQLQALIAANPDVLQNAAEFRTYACSLGLNPNSWSDLQTYFVDHSYANPGATAPPEWPSASVFGVACVY